MAEDADVIVVGGGLAGLVAATEIADAGKRVIVVEPVERREREAQKNGRLAFKFRHRVDTLLMTNGAVEGISGSVLEADSVERGKSSSRKVVGDFSLRAQAVIVASGGIGGNHEMV